VFRTYNALYRCSKITHDYVLFLPFSLTCTYGFCYNVYEIYCKENAPRIKELRSDMARYFSDLEIKRLRKQLDLKQEQEQKEEDV